MSKKIYFHVDEGSMPLELWDSKFERCKCYEGTEELINRGVEVIHTTSMAHFSFDLIDLGYDIYLCYKLVQIPIYPGMCMSPTGKELRRGHNIRKIFIAKCFDYMLGIKDIRGYYAYGNKEKGQYIKMAFEREGYSCWCDTHNEHLFIYTLPGDGVVKVLDTSHEDEKALADLIKRHQEYEMLEIASNDIQDVKAEEVIGEEKIEPIFKVGDKIMNCVQTRKITGIDYDNQCYMRDDGLQLEFSEQDQWQLAIPKFKEGQRIKKLRHDDAIYDINIVDDRSGMAYAVSWWEDYVACSKLIPFYEQDQYEVVPLFKPKTIDDAIEHVEKAAKILNELKNGD